MHFARTVIWVAAVVSLLATAGCSKEIDGTATPGIAPPAAPTVLIVDASQSMTENDAPGPRIDAAKKAAISLVEDLPPATEFSLVSYGAGVDAAPDAYAAGCRDISILRPLEAVDVEATRAAITRIMPRGFTPIADSLDRAAALLPRSVPVSIVLVSDGEDTCGKPPCPFAQELKKDRPELEISTVGFRTDEGASDQLRCIADATGGLFVTADNAAQLAERLRATRDEAAKNSIIDDGYLGVRLGTSLADIRAKHPDFPESGRTQGSRTVYDWRDCDWTTNSEGDLVEIAPRGRTARTVDGIGSGSTVGEAREYYGDPTSDTKNPDGSRTVVFAESGAGEAGYRMIVDGDGDDGVIRTIVICHCVVRTLDPCSGASGTCRHVADADVDGDGTADPIGVSIETTEETGRADTTVIGQAPVEARVAIRGKVHAVEYEVDGVFWKDPKDTYRGAYGISHATGADVVLYLAVSQGAPDVFGVARWNGSTLAALKPPTPSVRPQSSHPEQWWMGNVEQGRIVVNCRAPGTIAVDVSRRAPGADNSTDRTTTAYRFFGKGWVAGAIQTGPGPVLDYRPDGWKPETGAFACRDLGRRR